MKQIKQTNNHPSLTIQQQTLRVEHDLVPARREQVRDVARGLEAPELEEALVLAHRVAEELGGAGFSLRADDDGLGGALVGVVGSAEGGRWGRREGEKACP